MTGNDEDDAAVAKKMIEGKIEKIKSFRGDGAYDDFSLREKLGVSIEQIIPPPKDAVIHYGTKKKPLPDCIFLRNWFFVNFGESLTLTRDYHSLSE